MWEEEVAAYFKLLSQYLPGGSEGNHKNLSQDSQSPANIRTRVFREYETGLLTIPLLRTLNCSVCLLRAGLRPSATPASFI
jgi:hypothetical protein